MTNAIALPRDTTPTRRVGQAASAVSEPRAASKETLASDRGGVLLSAKLKAHRSRIKGQRSKVRGQRSEVRGQQNKSKIKPPKPVRRSPALRDEVGS